VVVEYLKFVASAFLFSKVYMEAKASGAEISMPRKQDIAWLMVPAAIYAMNNLLVFQAIKSTPLSTFGVIRETMLIWNALIWTTTFRQSISATRWLAIGGIFLGCSINQIPKMMNDEFTPGVFWAVLLAFSNAAGAVANEYAMKQRASIDINLQNCILYTFCGSFVLIGIAIFDNETVQSPQKFFSGFVPECWQVIILQVFTGLAVSRILKYVEAVTKTIVAAIRGPGVIFFGAFLFKTELGASEICATLVVCAACWIYLRQGPLVQQPPAAAKKEAVETDALLQKKAVP
jgi:UDP-sugar transporter A1/2/3